MGLDVHAVTKYNIIENPTDEQSDDLGHIYQHEAFHDQLGESLKQGMCIEMLECDGDFSMGYMGYGHFREFLASLAYPKATQDKPDFMDDDYENKHRRWMFPHIAGMYDKEDLQLDDDFVAIIHFSDCEGVIGNEYCKILDATFDKYMNAVTEDMQYYTKYHDMADCVKKAAQSGGYLDFH